MGWPLVSNLLMDYDYFKLFEAFRSFLKLDLASKAPFLISEPQERVWSFDVSPLASWRSSLVLR